MTGLLTDQLVDLTASVATLLDPDTVAGWTALNLFDSVLVAVTYVRQNATEEFLAAIFDVSQATVSRRRTALEAPITTALADVKPDPAAATRRDTVIVDGTLVPTSDWADPGDLFSGKHHRTGMNVQVACTTSGRLLGLGTPVHGAWHDAHAWRECGLVVQLPGCSIIADLGYLGVEGITAGARYPAGSELTDRQRTANTSLNGIRAVVEQTIAHVKNWKY